MNDEIKEILLEWKNGVETGTDKNDIKVGGICYEWKDLEVLLDYITNLQQDNEILAKRINELKNIKDERFYNLQQENERLKERVAYLERSNNRREDTIIGLRFEVAEQEDYKSRCEKASEKLGNYKHYSTPTEEQNSENEDIVDSALNILQNGSDEE